MNKTYGIAFSREVCKLNSSENKKAFNDDLNINIETLILIWEMTRFQIWTLMNLKLLYIYLCLLNADLILFLFLVLHLWILLSIT